MCGSETFTTVVSSTSRNVPSITATATIHGFTCRCSRWPKPWTSLPTTQWTLAVGTTLIPGRSAVKSWPGSKTIFTGTRCTTLT